MSEVSDYIRNQKLNMKTSRRYIRNINMKGGVDEEDDDTNTNNLEDIQKTNTSTSNETSSTVLPIQSESTPLNEGESEETIDVNKLTEVTEEQKNNPITSTFVTIDKDSFLYHPSQEVSHFDQSMLFVNVTKVLDHSSQRSFCMFFTPNEEYARRFSGLWSLNKRPVFVHKLKAKRDITNIKIIDANIVPDNMDNMELAKTLSGPTLDGTINGILIKHKSNDSNGKEQNIDEYYLCNPESMFTPIATWMQFGSTEWIKLGDTDKIIIPENKKEKIICLNKSMNDVNDVNDVNENNN